jgi:hypothetical protein
VTATATPLSTTTIRMTKTIRAMSWVSWFMILGLMHLSVKAKAALVADPRALRETQRLIPVSFPRFPSAQRGGQRRTSCLPRACARLFCLTSQGTSRSCMRLVPVAPAGEPQAGAV